LHRAQQAFGSSSKLSKVSPVIFAARAISQSSTTGIMSQNRAKETQMADNNRFRGWLCAVASAALFGVSAAIAPTASAQDTELKISSDAATSVDLRTVPEVPAVARPADLAINRPTMPMVD
jgi:hypothetical protein